MYELVSDITRAQAADRPGALALTWDGGSYTYGQLHDAVTRCAAALGAAGVGVGDRVAVVSANRPELVLLYFATARVGAIFCPLNVWHRAAEHEATLADCEPKLLFVDPDLADRLPPTAIEFDGPGWASFLAAGAGRDVVEGPRDPSAPHQMIYTSGTTGPAKGVLLPHARTLADGYQLLARLHLVPEDVFPAFFPTFHVGNWDVVKLFWMAGARVHLLRAFDEEAIVEAVERERVTVLLGMPTMFYRLAMVVEETRRDLFGALRLLWLGGFDAQGVTRRMVDIVRRHVPDVRLFHTYGLTEAGPYVTVATDQDIRAAWGSVGRPPPGVEVAIRADDGTPVADGTPGELWYRGPRMTGYWRRPDATAAVVDGDWLATGDVAYRDAEGFIWLVDRKKDVIRTGSQNVYSREVEEALLQHAAVEDVAVFGVPDAEYEERVTAAVVLASGVVGDESFVASLQDDLRSRIAGYKVPRQIVVLDELPRNAMGKVQKVQLRALVGDGPVTT